MVDIDSYELKFDSAIERLETELKKVRTGRAHPSMLETVSVEVYGVKMPINQVANITAADAQMLVVTPFDAGNIQAIAGAIRTDQSLGFNPSDDGRVIRVPIPALTEERRKQLVKQTSEKLEAAKISIRAIRQDANKDAKRQQNAKELGEDDVKRIEKEIERLKDAAEMKCETAFKRKEQDLLTI